MNKITEIIDLAGKLPSGLQDNRALEKLIREREELLQALGDHDYTGALAEAADNAYYAIKHLEYISWLVNIPVEQLFDLAIAKYSLRAKPGNKKNDAAEREAVARVIFRQ